MRAGPLFSSRTITRSRACRPRSGIVRAVALRVGVAPVPKLSLLVENATLCRCCEGHTFSRSRGCKGPRGRLHRPTPTHPAPGKNLPPGRPAVLQRTPTLNGILPPAPSRAQEKTQRLPTHSWISAGSGPHCPPHPLPTARPSWALSSAEGPASKQGVLQGKPTAQMVCLAARLNGAEEEASSAAQPRQQPLTLNHGWLRDRLRGACLLLLHNLDRRALRICRSIHGVLYSSRDRPSKPASRRPACHAWKALEGTERSRVGLHTHGPRGMQINSRSSIYEDWLAMHRLRGHNKRCGSTMLVRKQVFPTSKPSGSHPARSGAMPSRAGGAVKDINPAKVAKKITINYCLVMHALQYNQQN